jgi:hypothetical protein
MVKDFLQLAGDKGVVFSEVRKDEPPEKFRVENATWALILVYNQCLVKQVSCTRCLRGGGRILLWDEGLRSLLSFIKVSPCEGASYARHTHVDRSLRGSARVLVLVRTAYCLLS